jgi:hypothetical protein
MTTLVIKTKSEETRYSLKKDYLIHTTGDKVIVYEGNITYGKVAEFYAIEWYIEGLVTRVQKSLWERIKDAF